MAAGVLLILLGVWLLVRLFRGGLAAWIAQRVTP